MKRRVLVIGHADDDGHVIAEQTRRNLTLIPTFDVGVFVDPIRTQGHQSWRSLSSIGEIDGASLIFFVDMMFSPTTFVAEAEGLTSFARARPDKTFFIIDHHPLPERRLASVENIRAIYRPDVFECTLGPRSGLMVLAAICERQSETIAPIRRPHHDVLARGLRRAAAPGGALPGRRLMALLAGRRWDVIYALGEDDPLNHRLVRGRRLSEKAPSKHLIAAGTAAEGLEERLIKTNMGEWSGESGSGTMPFDLDAERYVPQSTEKKYRNAPVPTKDLETLVTILEVAALSLTDKPGATFTVEQLIAEARTIAGEGAEIDDRDAKNVVDKASFVAYSGPQQLRLK